MAEITIEELKNDMAFKSITILTLDERWYHLIPEKAKTEKVKELEEKVNTLLKKQGQVNTDIKELKKIKTKLIQEVVDNMEADETDPKHQQKMNQNQRLIQEAKEKIAQLEDESLDVPTMLARANQELAFETIRFCYEKMNANKEDIELLDKWINETRIKLKKNLLIKQDKETRNEQSYSYLHDILGADLMGTLDKINEK